MLSTCCTQRLGAMRQLRGSAPAGMSKMTAAVPVRRLSLVARVGTGDDSETMGRDNWEANKLPEEVVFTELDIKQGNVEGSSPQAQPIGTEMGQEAEQHSSGAGSGHQQAQEKSQGQQAPQGGRFDEEAVPGDHPYDPRPRERGHGIPPHKDASNTGPAHGSS